jgi:hypothetical protein
MRVYRGPVDFTDMHHMMLPFSTRDKLSRSSLKLEMPYPGREARFCQSEFQLSFRRLRGTKWRTAWYH